MSMIGKKSVRAVAAGVTTLVATVGFTVLGAAAANAAVVGSLSFTPRTGLDTSSIVLNTSAACPADPNAQNLQARVFGSGFPAGGQVVVSNSSQGAYSTNSSGGYVVPLADTMRAFANLQSPPATLSGKYDLVLTCRAAAGSYTSGDFTGSIWFTSNTSYQDVDPNGSTATTTAVAASPASPQQSGTAVTFTATVSPAGYAGTVQFKDGGSPIGSPVAVNTANGTAALSTSSLSVGTHSISATYTPSVAGLNPSTSTPLSYTIEAAPAQPTTTALAVQPASGSATQYDNVTLTATVSPASAAGTVQFKDGGTNLGSPVALSGGVATLTRTFAQGTHSFTAHFVPADPAAYNPSSSDSFSYDVAGFSGVTASETISTTVEPGALVLSVADPTVVLPSPVLNEDGTLFTTAGDMNDVTVTDTRAGNPGWSVSGQVSDFSGPAGDINGANLGWTPALRSKAAAQTVNVGAVVAPANGVAPGTPWPSGVGLKDARTLGAAPSGAGNGTALLGAALALNVPTSTVAGTYTATLTLTAI